MQLRDYQSESIDALFGWWGRYTELDDIPILSLPTGAGKSLIIAGITDYAFQQWPDHHPRTLVIVPSKELAEQNAEKISAVLPTNISVGFYSASLGKKQPNADVIVATIGTIAKASHLLGNIKLVLIDECHLIRPDGTGQYRIFLRDLARYCQFRVAGLTATPFRGDGVWLTDGKDPLFTGIAYEVPVKRLLDAGFLSPLVRPSDVLTTIDTAGVTTVNGDYHTAQLAEVVDRYLVSAAIDTVRLARDRRKWIAFCPTVETAEHFASLLQSNGASALVVTGKTAPHERESRIEAFRAGQVRCLVSVLALTTGFDVPDVDCVIWLRPTKSPVLYVQGAGRGLRVARGKVDCLWLDFSDTTERLGPIDAIRGRKKSTNKEPGEAPFAVCDNCGAQVRPAALLRCPECDALMREETERLAREASNAAILSSQIEQKLTRYEIDRVTYAKHEKPGKPASLRVEYWAGLRIVAREWACLEHGGFAEAKARKWWQDREPEPMSMQPNTVSQALEWIEGGFVLRQPTAITINETSRYPEIVDYEFNGPESATPIVAQHAGAA